MPDLYTYIQKPTDATYEYSNPQGKEHYDQASITYDDPQVFYDGINQSAYTDIIKPTSSSYTFITKPTT
jgi:glutaredoxin